MPYTIKTGYLNVKDENGQYIRNNTVAEQSTAEQIAEIEAASATQQAAIVAKGNETRQSIPSDYTALSNAVTAEVTAREAADDELKSAVSYNEVYVDELAANRQILRATWIHGRWLGNGTLNTDIKYSIATKEKISFDEPITFNVMPGYDMRALRYNKSTGVFQAADAITTTSYTFTGSWLYNVTIAISPSDSSVVVDIPTTVTKVYSTITNTKQLNILRTGRLLDTFAKDGSDRVLYGQSITYRDGLYYTCGSYNDNANQVIAAYRNSRQAPYIVSRYTNLGHANSITSTSQYLIVAKVENTIAILNRSGSFDWVKDIDVSSVARSVYAVSNYLGNIYFIGYAAESTTELVIGKLDIAGDSASIVCTIKKPNNLVLQGMTVLGKYAYLSFSKSNMVYKYDLTTGEATEVYYIPDGDGYNPVGEVEDMFKIENDIYMVGVPYFNIAGAMTNGKATCVQIFKTNLIKPLEKDIPENYMLPLSNLSVTVDDETTFEFNPHGNYTTVEEAAYILNYFKRGFIDITSITKGQCYLLGGNYAVRAETLVNVDRIAIINSVAIIKNIKINGTCAVVTSYAHLIDCEYYSLQNTDSIIT